MEAFKIHTVAEDGKPLSHDRLFQAWVQLAGNLAKMLPDGPCRQLCEAVYEAVTADGMSGQAPAASAWNMPQSHRKHGSEND